MSQGQGHQLAVAIAEETVYGADHATPDAVKVYLDEFGVMASQDYTEDGSVASRTPDEPLPNVIDVAGSIKPKFAPENIGTLLKHALGTSTPTGIGPYVHTMAIGDLPVGITIDKDMGARLAAADRYEKFNGNRVAGFSVEFGGEAQPSISFDIKGASRTFAGSPLDATITDNGCTKFSLFNATVQEGGAAAADITAGTITYANNFDESGYAVNDNGVRSQLDEGKVSVSGEVTARFKTKALLQKAIDNTTSSLKLTLSQGDGLGSSGNGSLELFVQSLKFKPTSPEVSGPHGIMVKLSYTAFSSNALTAVLKNALATV